MKTSTRNYFVVVNGTQIMQNIKVSSKYSANNLSILEHEVITKDYPAIINQVFVESFEPHFKLTGQKVRYEIFKREIFSDGQSTAHHLTIFFRINSNLSKPKQHQGGVSEIKFEGGVASEIEMVQISLLEIKNYLDRSS